MKFELEPFHRNITDSELLHDLQNVDRTLKEQDKTLSYRLYNDVGKYSASTIHQRFGSWNKALIKAGLKPSEEKNVSVDALFENLRKVWLYKKKQPVFRDMNLAPSQYGPSLYVDRFGSWRKALKEFFNFVQSDNWIKDDVKKSNTQTANKNRSERKKRKTNRNISDRMRFRILLRDGFACQSCGASPLIDRGVELHVDHIIPWSKGGETEEGNLQTKCKKCNLGKGNAFMR